MKVTRKKLSALRHPERNVRLHTDRQLTEFKRSIDMFGQIRPIVVDEDGVILAGNGLYEALLSMGQTEADCYVVAGLSEAEKKKLMLADNRIFNLGIDDSEAFDAIISELKDTDIPGFDKELLSTLIASDSEVDKIISDYGSFSPTTRELMRSNEEGEAAPMGADAPQGSEPTPPEQGGRHIVCPKCGERIPL